MARADDILTLDYDLDSPEWKQEDSNRRPGARRSLELYLERRALRRQLEDTFGEDCYGMAELDM
ncbi:MAG: PA3496 family putative envelope integrity protein [Thioalkalivibrio sp.]